MCEITREPRGNSHFIILSATGLGTLGLRITTFYSFGVACRDHFGTATPTISHGFPGNPREKPQNLSVTSTKLCLKWAFRVLKSQKFPQMVGTRRHRAHKRARHRAQKRGGQSARVHPRVRDPKWDFPLGSRNNSFRPLYNNSLRGGSRVMSNTDKT